MELRLAIDKIISSIILTLLTLYIFSQIIGLVKTWQKYQAIDACSLAGHVTYITPDKATVEQPNKEWYEQCLKDKGLK